MVKRLWSGGTVVCIASGPSLCEADVTACRDRAPVIVINDTYQLAPWAAVLYACDARWWKRHNGVPAFIQPKYALEAGAAQWPGVTVLRNTGEHGLERDPVGLRTGMNSGYQAINLAIHLGADHIVLLGYDMQPAEDGRTHWYGGHVSQCDTPYAKFRACFETMVEPLRDLGVSVVNATRRTALTTFPYVPLEEAIT